MDFKSDDGLVFREESLGNGWSSRHIGRFFPALCYPSTRAHILEHFAFDAALNSMILEILIEQSISEWQCQDVNNKGKPRESGERKQKQCRLSQN